MMSRRSRLFGLLLLIWSNAAAAVAENHAAPCRVTAAGFIVAWNKNTSQLTIGSWHLPALGVVDRYEQALDGPGLLIRIRQTPQGCLDSAEIWSRHDSAVAGGALVGWLELTDALGMPHTEARDLLNELKMTSSLPLGQAGGQSERHGIVYRFGETMSQNSFRATPL